MMVRSILPAAVAGVLMVAAGVALGVHNGRWQQSGDVTKAVRALEGVPQEFGEWRGVNRTVEEDALIAGGIKGYVHRVYRNSRTGSEVTALLVCGRPGPIAVHTPDVCYAGAGYQPIGEQTRSTIDGADPATFWLQRFRSPGTAVMAADLEIHWAWSVGRGWSAPDSPRWEFASYPILYKLYVVRELSPSSRAAPGNPAEEFMTEFLPLVNGALRSEP